MHTGPHSGAPAAWWGPGQPPAWTSGGRLGHVMSHGGFLRTWTSQWFPDRRHTKQQNVRESWGRLKPAVLPCWAQLASTKLSPPVRREVSLTAWWGSFHSFLEICILIWSPNLICSQPPSLAVTGNVKLYQLTFLWKFSEISSWKENLGQILGCCMRQEMFFF